jgi:chitinase
MDKLSKKTGKRYSLSTAVPASAWFVKAIDVAAAANIVDALKLMSYDYYGGWSNTTGHLANIFNNPKDRGGSSTDQAVNEYLKAGVPPQKIQMGFAFYGRAFQGVSPGPNNDGLYQRFESVPFGEGEVTWSQVAGFLKPGSGFTRYWDDTAKSPYIYNGDIWITYCDEQMISELVNYVNEKKLGGFFVWEYAADMNAELLKVLSDNALKK